MSKNVIIKLIVLVLSFVPLTYAMPPFTSTAAITGDEVISIYDLKERVQLLVNSQSHPLTRNEIQEIIPLALQELLDEVFLYKDAKEHHISISENELQELINKLSQDNKIEISKFETVLKNRKIPLETLKNQLKAQLIKSKIVSEIILPKIHVTDREVFEAIHTNRNSEISLLLKEIAIKFSDNNDMEKKRKDINDFRLKITNCDNIEIINNKLHAKFNVTPKNIKLNDINDQLRNEILNTDINKTTKVFKVDNMLKCYVICSKEYIGLTPNEKSAIFEMLMQNKLSLQMNLYLTQLRKRHHVEIKTENLQHLTFPQGVLNVIE